MNYTQESIGAEGWISSTVAGLLGICTVQVVYAMPFIPILSIDDAQNFFLVLGFCGICRRSSVTTELWVQTQTKAEVSQLVECKHHVVLII